MTLPPTPHPSSRTSQQGHAVRPRPGLLGRRQSPWRCLAHPDLAEATALHPCPPVLFPVLSTVHLLGSCMGPPLPTLPGPQWGRHFFQQSPRGVLQVLLTNLEQVLLSRPQFSPLENGSEVEQNFAGPSLDVRFSQRPGEGRWGRGSGGEIQEEGSRILGTTPPWPAPSLTRLKVGD